jgi:hypothetical protein
MNEKKFKGLIKKDKYQVFLFISKCKIPLIFASHPWFVISKKGKLSRWEILRAPGCCKTSWKHLHLNFLPPTIGLNIFSKKINYNWKSKFLGSIEGDANSFVKKMIDVIEDSPKEYIFNKKYSLFGPNSNSYIQWILDKFPESNLKLPFNSFGKKYDFCT